MSIRWVLEGIPCVEIDRKKKTIFMVPPEEREEEVISFYESVENDNLAHFAVSPERTPSFEMTLKKKVREILPGVEVICDHPEPSLVSFTSAGGSGTRHDLIHTLQEGFRQFFR